jgi:hypothetical protein
LDDEVAGVWRPLARRLDNPLHCGRRMNKGAKRVPSPSHQRVLLAHANRHKPSVSSVEHVASDDKPKARIYGKN